MRILLFGISNVGKTTTGKQLSEKLDIPFFDLDDEVKKRLNISLEEFVKTGTLRESDGIRLKVLESLLDKTEDAVIVVTPISYSGNLLDLLNEPDIIAIKMRDTPEHIYDRIVFSDENDVIYRDDEYKEKHRAFYLKEIYEDLKWYGSVNRFIVNKFDMNGMCTELVVNRMIQKYGLNR